MASELPQIGKLILGLGIILVLVGLFILIGKELPFLNKIGKLPGDIRIEKEGFSFYFPLTTCVLVSALLTAVSFIYKFFFKS